MSLVGGVSNVGEMDSLIYVQIWGSGVSTSGEFCVILGEIIITPSQHHLKYMSHTLNILETY